MTLARGLSSASCRLDALARVSLNCARRGDVAQAAALVDECAKELAAGAIEAEALAAPLSPVMTLRDAGNIQGLLPWKDSLRNAKTPEEQLLAYWERRLRLEGEVCVFLLLAAAGVDARDRECRVAKQYAHLKHVILRNPMGLPARSSADVMHWFSLLTITRGDWRGPAKQRDHLRILDNVASGIRSPDVLRHLRWSLGFALLDSHLEAGRFFADERGLDLGDAAHVLLATMLTMERRGTEPAEAAALIVNQRMATTTREWLRVCEAAAQEAR
jgi:hypothetical protein